MEDRSSFPGPGSDEAAGSRAGREEDGPKCRSSRCPCKLRSTQLQRAQALTLLSTCVLEVAAAVSDVSSAAEGASDSLSEGTDCSVGALSSAVGSETFSSQFDFGLSIPSGDLLDRDLTM